MVPKKAYFRRRNKNVSAAGLELEAFTRPFCKVRFARAQCRLKIELRAEIPSAFEGPETGERGRTRTCDPCLKRALLYQLSYAPALSQYYCIIWKAVASASSFP
jgi:hypothetical protein